MTRWSYSVRMSLNIHDQAINSLFLPLLSLLYICQPDQYHPCSGLWGLQRILSPVNQPEACLQTLQGKISHQVLFFSHSSPPPQFGNKCNINLTNRKRCQECRLAKCYAKVKEDRRCDCHEVFLGGICRAWKRSAFRRSRRRLQAWRGKSGLKLFHLLFTVQLPSSSCIDLSFRKQRKQPELCFKNHQNFFSVPAQRWRTPRVCNWARDRGSTRSHLLFIMFFIGPESDHCLPLSLTHSLTH